jgi:hypothetical protein
MTCKQYQKQIRVTSSWPVELTQHIKSCESCKSFAETVRQSSSLKDIGIATPESLRENTKTEALSFLSGNQIQNTNLKILWNSPKFVIGLLFAFLVIFIIAFNTNLYWENDFQRNFNWTVLITIILQNMIMAIFVPIFFSTKSNLFNIFNRS